MKTKGTAGHSFSIMTKDTLLVVFAIIILRHICRYTFLISTRVTVGLRYMLSLQFDLVAAAPFLDTTQWSFRLSWSRDVPNLHRLSEVPFWKAGQ